MGDAEERERKRVSCRGERESERDR
jgi:hypothetical protein